MFQELSDLPEMRRAWGRQCAWCGWPVPREAEYSMHDGCRDEADAND